MNPYMYDQANKSVYFLIDGESHKLGLGNWVSLELRDAQMDSRWRIEDIFVNDAHQLKMSLHTPWLDDIELATRVGIATENELIEIVRDEGRYDFTLVLAVYLERFMVRFQEVKKEKDE